jgi:dethiobiotin synthetase
MTGWVGPILITGTDTGVGKTIVTAAITVGAQQAGLRVAVLKTAQTGNDDDVTTIAELAAPATVRTFVRYPAPLAPLAAARAAEKPPMRLEPVVAAVHELADRHDLVLVEGAGGVLVPMGANGWTVRDLAACCGMSVVVVARAGLGTLNHTALTVEALGDRRTVVVLGAWPKAPELVHRSNLTDLRGIVKKVAADCLPDGASTQIAGAVPEGAGALIPDRFRAAAPGWLAPELHGTFDLRQLHDKRVRHPKREVVRAPRRAHNATVT